MLSAIPPKMAALFALASILCHIVALGLLVQTRVELSTVRGAADAPHRLLESSDVGALAPVRAQLEGVRAELEAVRADKRRSDERVELLSSHVERLGEELQETHRRDRGDALFNTQPLLRCAKILSRSSRRTELT